MHYTVSTKKRLHAFSEPNFYVLHYTKENQTHPHAPTSCLRCYSFVFKKIYIQVNFISKHLMKMAMNKQDLIA